MQLTLLGVNFFLITIISREYGAEIYGEYAASKSLSVLIGTATVLSLALVVTKLRAQNVNFKDSLFAKSFIDIWIGKNTSRPNLRNKLIGDE